MVFEAVLVVVVVLFFAAVVVFAVLVAFFTVVVLLDVEAAFVAAFAFSALLVVFCVGHLLNLVINVLGTFVHTSRLQYIEFFGKFYEDGGEAFKPALPAEEYSEDTSFVLNETNN